MNSLLGGANFTLITHGGAGARCTQTFAEFFGLELLENESGAFADPIPQKSNKSGAQKRKEKKPRRKSGAQKRKKKKLRRNAYQAALDALVLVSAGGADHIVSTGGSSPGLYQNPTETKDQCISAVPEPCHRVWLEPLDGRSYPPADSAGDDACLDFEGLEEDACWDAEGSEEDDGDAEGARC